MIREVGLLDYLAERFAIISSPTEVASRLRGSDLDAQMRRFGAEVIAPLKEGLA